ncbi:putative leader peptide [Nakamurella multipartita]
MNVAPTEFSCPPASAAWFCRRHVDLQRVASALCPGC